MIKPDIKAHTESAKNSLNLLSSSHHGLSLDEAKHRLQQYGLNTLPRLKQPGIFMVFIHQFSSTLIYVLVVAAAVSILLQEWSDAGFIFAVLPINAVKSMLFLFHNPKHT